MSLSFAPARFSLFLALFSVVSVSLVSQALAQQQTPAPPTAQNETQNSAPAAIPMEEEGHHHLIFQNAYVKIFYVEIPPHESTLFHHHDLPYVSLPRPPLPDAPPSVAAGREPIEHSPPPRPRVSYALGGFSHTVNNKTDVTLRNIAVELLRPQGTARNGCEQVIRDQPTDGQHCSQFVSGRTLLPQCLPSFETDEITVEYCYLAPGTTTAPGDAQLSTLVGGMDGIVNVIVNGDARPLPQAGLVWLLPGSKTAFETGKDSPGHFVTIVFKDSALKQ